MILYLINLVYVLHRRSIFWGDHNRVQCPHYNRKVSLTFLFLFRGTYETRRDAIAKDDVDRVTHNSSSQDVLANIIIQSQLKANI